MDLTWAHRVYLDGNMLPQTPDKITFEHEDRTESIVLANGNSFTIGRRDGPMTIKFDFYVTYEDYPFTFKKKDYPEIRRMEWSDIFWEWKLDQYAFRLDIVRPINAYKDEIYLNSVRNNTESAYVDDFHTMERDLAKVYSDVSMMVLLTDWTFEEDANHGNDFKYSVTLKEYFPAINQEVNFDIEHHLVKNRTAKGWRSGGRWRTPGT